MSRRVLSTAGELRVKVIRRPSTDARSTASKRTESPVESMNRNAEVDDRRLGGIGLDGLELGPHGVGAGEVELAGELE